MLFFQCLKIAILYFLIPKLTACYFWTDQHFSLKSKIKFIQTCKILILLWVLLLFIFYSTHRQDALQLVFVGCIYWFWIITLVLLFWLESRAITIIMKMWLKVNLLYVFHLFIVTIFYKRKRSAFILVLLCRNLHVQS